jgi:hypothetical protein
MLYYAISHLISQLEVRNGTSDYMKVPVDGKMYEGLIGFLPVFDSIEKAKAFEPNGEIITLETIE